MEGGLARERAPSTRSLCLGPQPYLEPPDAARLRLGRQVGNWFDDALEAQKKAAQEAAKPVTFLDKFFDGS